MADTKLSGLSALSSVAIGDLVYVVDISDTTDDAAGSSKKITQADLVATPSNTFVGQQIFLTGTTGNTPAIYRQTGGIAGTDEVQVGYDGDNGIIRVKDGGLIIYAVNLPTLSVRQQGTEAEFFQVNYTGITISGQKKITFQDSSTFVFVVVDVGVVSCNYYNGAVVGAWIQNSAGRTRITTPVTNITTAFASLTDLTINLIAGRKYTGFVRLPINNALAADGFKLDLNGGSATMTSIEFGWSEALGATVGVRTSTALATAITLTVLPDTNDLWVTVPVTLVCNAAGTIIPRQAKNADAAGATLTLRTGGHFWLEDMPA